MNLNKKVCVENLSKKLDQLDSSIKILKLKNIQLKQDYKNNPRKRKIDSLIWELKTQDLIISKLKNVFPKEEDFGKFIKQALDMKLN